MNKYELLQALRDLEGKRLQLSNALDDIGQKIKRIEKEIELEEEGDGNV